jgi:enhancer of polycomb-like protein
MVHAWWKHRRFTLRNGKQITPHLKFDEIPGVHDYYVCFRKREQKPLRKTRRCDSVSLDKLTRLAAEMTAAREILAQVAERERLRREILEIDVRVFEARIRVRRMKKLMGLQTQGGDIDQSPEKARKKTSRTIKLKLAPARFGNGGVELESASVEDRIKRRRGMDEREGWADLTEV